MIAVVDYGAGNLRSVELALDRLDVAHRRAASPSELEDADGIVLPGVGAAESAMAELGERGLVGPLREATVPLLGVCLGMQLLTDTSDEGSSEVECLGLVPGRTRRFRGDVRLPHIGWNAVRPTDGEALFVGLAGPEWFYFLHGHRVDCDAEWIAGTSEYGEPFPAALRRGRVAGVQFHPEKSGSGGLRVLANFCASCGG